MRKNEILRNNDGDLVIRFSFSKGASMLEMEEQIEKVVNSINEPISELDIMNIRMQLLDLAVKSQSPK
jgi:hypothetical protein